MVKTKSVHDTNEPIKPSAWAMGYAITNRSYLLESPAETLKRMRTAAIKAGTYVPSIDRMESGTGFMAKRTGTADEERFLLVENNELIDVNGDICEISDIDVSTIHALTLPNEKEL